MFLLTSRLIFVSRSIFDKLQSYLDLFLGIYNIHIMIFLLTMFCRKKYVKFTFELNFQKIEASAIEDFYGLASDMQKTSESGYILFYQSRE